MTLGILTSLYPQDNLDVVGDGFAASYTEVEASKLLENSIVTTEHIVEMLLVDMS
jgi:hypothetical protein